MCVYIYILMDFLVYIHKNYIQCCHIFKKSVENNGYSFIQFLSKILKLNLNVFYVSININI